MSEEKEQDLKEKEETLNLTGKELDEYKTYLKFKNEIEKQNQTQEDVKEKSQNVTQNQSTVNKPSGKSTTKSFQKDMDTMDMNDPDYTFDEDSIEKMGYKEYFMEPIDIKPIEEYRNELIREVKIKLVAIFLFYWGFRNRNGAGWFIFKIIFGLYAMKQIIYIVKRLIATEPTSMLKPKINSYSTLIRDAEWVKLSNEDKDFMKYYSIAKDTIKNKLQLIKGRPNFKRDKYTEVYHILNSDVYVVYGIYDSIGFISTSHLGYMLVIENEECILNLISTVVLREKLIILDDI